MRIHIPVGLTALFLASVPLVAVQRHVAPTPNVAAPALAIPIAAGGGWSTDVAIRNTSFETVTQVFRRKIVNQPPFDPQVVEDTVTLAPGETRWITAASKNFDDGLWIMSLDARIEASAFLHFKDVTAFEVSGVRPLTKVGEAADFFRVVVNPAMGLGTYPVVMNTSTKPTFVEIQVFGPTGERIDDKQVSAPPGISQSAIAAYAPLGATLHVCLGGCAFGAGGDGLPVYVFVAVGPPSGATQAIRYPQ